MGQYTTKDLQRELWDSTQPKQGIMGNTQPKTGNYGTVHQQEVLNYR